MNKTFKFKKFILKSISGEVIFQKDFSQDTILNGQSAQAFLINGASINTFNDTNNTIFELTITKEISEISELNIIKFNSAKKIEVRLNSNLIDSTIDQAIKEFFEIEDGQTFNWNNLFIDSVKQSINSIEAIENYLNTYVNPKNVVENIEDLKAQAYKDFSPEQIEKADKVRETSVRIKNLEKEVEFFQNEKKLKEDLGKQKTDSESQIKQLKEKLESVNNLIQIKENLKKEIQTFEDKFKTPEARNSIKNIKNTRLDHVISSMKSIRSNNIMSFNTDGADDELISGRALFILPVLQFVISIVWTIATLNLIHLFLGFISIIIIVYFILLINISKYQYEYDHRFLKKDNKILATKKYNDVVKDYPASENKSIVNIAWAGALINELSATEELINSRLGDKKLDQINVEINEVESRIKSADSKLLEIEAKTMTSEEYYKKRREIDILKIEKENLEYSLEVKVPEELESKIVNILAGKVESLSLYPIILINSISNEIKTYLQTKQNQVIFVSTN